MVARQKSGTKRVVRKIAATKPLNKLQPNVVTANHKLASTNHLLNATVDPTKKKLVEFGKQDDGTYC